MGLSKVYKLPAEEISALKSIGFTINEGEFISVIGPSGAGKTTLLNLIGCIDNVSFGQLEIFGQNVSDKGEEELSNVRRKNIGFIFQDSLLISSLTALENVELPLYFSRLKDEEKRSEKLLEIVGLKKRLYHFPEELSGGEMQRVAIARALATSPKIILADEPTGNLDTKNAKAIFDLFRQLNKEQGITIIVATHNIKLGHQADRVIHLNDGIIEKEECN